MIKPGQAQGKRHRRGFVSAAGVLGPKIRKIGETRGFAVARLLTHWEEIVGEEIAAMALPVKVSYSQGGFGATLTVLTTGAFAPMLQAELPRVKERVNACYGYTAIARIHITQTAPVGFAEGQVAFHGQQKRQKPPPDPQVQEKARETVIGIRDEGLRRALEALGQNVLSRRKG